MNFGLKKSVVGRLMFPVGEGWVEIPGYKLHRGEHHMLFTRAGYDGLHIVMFCESPYVNPVDMDLAQTLVSHYKTDLNLNADVTLVYGELLIRPQRMPNGVRVVSIAECNSEKSFTNLN